LVGVTCNPKPPYVETEAWWRCY